MGWQRLLAVYAGLGPLVLHAHCPPRDATRQEALTKREPSQDPQEDQATLPGPSFRADRVRFGPEALAHLEGKRACELVVEHDVHLVLALWPAL